MRAVFLKTAILLVTFLISFPVWAESVAFYGPDGQVLNGEYFPGPSKNAVILLHMKGRTHQDFGFLFEKLKNNRFSVLSYDLRGHGQSVLVRNGQIVSWDALSRGDYQMMAQDLARAVAWIQDRAGRDTRIHLLGADLGATIILDFLSGLPADQNYPAILISPGLDYGDLDINSQKLDKLKGRDLFLISGRGDSYSFFSCQYLTQRLGLKGPSRKFLWSAHHGTALLFENPRLVDTLIKGMLKKGEP